MKKALELLQHCESIFDMDMFFNVTVTENRIDFMATATTENVTYFKDIGYIFEYNNNINMLISSCQPEFEITLRIILSLN